MSSIPTKATPDIVSTGPYPIANARLYRAILELIEEDFEMVRAGAFTPRNAAEKAARLIVGSLEPGNHLDRLIARQHGHLTELT